MARRFCMMPSSCTRTAVTRGLCALHYSRARQIVVEAGYNIRNISNEELLQSLIAGRLIINKRKDFSTILQEISKQCAVPNCENNHHAKGLCESHYKRAVVILKKRNEKIKDFTIKQLIEILKNNPKKLVFKHFICSIPECNNNQQSRGMCNKHLQRAKYILKQQNRSTKELTNRELTQLVIDMPARGKKKRDAICTIPDCNNDQIARGLCDNHYTRVRDILKKQNSKISEVSDEELIQLLIAKPAIKQTRKGEHCIIPDCGKPQKAVGLCNAHYNKMRRIIKKLDSSIKVNEYSEQELIWIIENNPRRHIIKHFICSIPKCNNNQQSRGMCDKHFQRAKYILKQQNRSTKELTNRELTQLIIDRPVRDKKKRDGICTIPDCNNDQKAKGLCGKHYTRVRDILKKQDRKLSEVPDIELIQLLIANPAIKQKKKGKHCIIPDCEKSQKAVGLCDAHYKKVRKIIKKLNNSLKVNECSEQELIWIIENNSTLQTTNSP